MRRPKQIIDSIRTRRVNGRDCGDLDENLIATPLPAAEPNRQVDVTFGFYDPVKQFPLVIRPARPSVNLKDWIRGNYALVQEKLHTVGAILFRGFTEGEEQDFVDIVQNMPFSLLHYLESSTPRKELGAKNIYTATEFPSHQVIPQHNELSYVSRFPMRAMLYCVTPSLSGGETPLCDGRKLYQDIDPEVRNAFETKGWRLVRNYGDGFGLDWRTSYHTDDPREMEAYAAKERVRCVWKDQNRVATIQTRPVSMAHPVTGEMVWFSHMSFWHVANLDPKMRAVLEEEFGLDGLPYHTYFADGTIIPDEYAQHIESLYQKHKVFFPWEKGDFVIIDNVLVSHGRHAYEGDRRTLFTMGDACYWKDVKITYPNYEEVSKLALTSQT